MNKIKTEDRKICDICLSERMGQYCDRVSGGWGSKVKEYVRREIAPDLCKKSKGKLQL